MRLLSLPVAFKRFDAHATKTRYEDTRTQRTQKYIEVAEDGANQFNDEK